MTKYSDPQKVFDKVINHLVTQDCQAKYEGECAYRGENGTSCAVGCLIPDELYKPEMETNDVGGLLSGFPELQEVIDPELEPLLLHLQNLHDSYCGPYSDSRTFDYGVKVLARSFNLEVPECITSI